VSIKCTRSVGTGLGRAPMLDGQGSGVIVSADGYIITNAHVVAGATYIEVTLYDRHVFPARLIGVDATTDLAVVKISASGLIPAEWGDSDQLNVGSLVWAIGSPYGLDQSVTSGIISGRNRYEQNARTNTPQQELLQTDAAVNPGNSGGPLVNARGELVGINTAIVGEAFQGISFAVPSAVARFVSEQLIGSGRVSRGFLGITPHPVTPEHQIQFKLPDLNGAILRNVDQGTPGFEAGFLPGDVIRSWNGQPIEDYLLIYRLVAMTPPNTQAVVEIIRDGKPLTINIKVGERPDAYDRPLRR
ncbi:MAG TPA: trypsin-like peptidase domain-containing protein, partial [Pirellulaceae bacterium]|nr:trypsin-like peptidase domain-containing protein [Pirellulaceae bacterium]